VKTNVSLNKGLTMMLGKGGSRTFISCCTPVCELLCYQLYYCAFCRKLL